MTRKSLFLCYHLLPPLVARDDLCLELPRTAARYFKLQSPEAAAQRSLIKANGLVRPLRIPLIRLTFRVALTFIFHQLVEKLLMLFLSLGLQVAKKLFGQLHSLPTFGRFYSEGFACSHGCIAFLKVQGFVFHC